MLIVPRHRQTPKPYFLLSSLSSSMSSMSGNRGRGWCPRQQSGRGGIPFVLPDPVSKESPCCSPEIDHARPRAASRLVQSGDVSVESVNSPQLERSRPRGVVLSAHSEVVSSGSMSSPQCQHSTPQDSVSLAHPGQGSRERMSSPHVEHQHGGYSSQKNNLFDICRDPFSKAPVLNRSLFEKNREKRLQAALSKVDDRHQRLRPGMILLKKFLSQEVQTAIIKSCRDLGVGPGGFYKPGYDDGAKLRLWMMCLAKNWNPVTNAYESRRSVDGAEPPQIPDFFKELVENAMQASYAVIKQVKKQRAEDELPALLPDLCIVNFYSKSGKLGLHQDKDESPDSLNKGLPVVSFSIGDSADFLYGDDRNEHIAECIKLESGDVLIFGGKSRHIFHGVSKIHEGTAPGNLIDESNLRPGRLNLTFRQY